jgi:hypothetical protein
MTLDWLVDILKGFVAQIGRQGFSDVVRVFRCEATLQSVFLSRKIKELRVDQDN